MPDKRKLKYKGGAGATSWGMGVYGPAGGQSAISPDNNFIAQNARFAMQSNIKGGKSKRVGNYMAVPFNLMMKKYSNKGTRRKTNKVYKRISRSRKNKTRR